MKSALSLPLPPPPLYPLSLPPPSPISLISPISLSFLFSLPPLSLSLPLDLSPPPPLSHSLSFSFPQFAKGQFFMKHLACPCIEVSFEHLFIWFTCWSSFSVAGPVGENDNFPFLPKLRFPLPLSFSFPFAFFPLPFDLTLCIPPFLMLCPSFYFALRSFPAFSHRTASRLAALPLWPVCWPCSAWS